MLFPLQLYYANGKHLSVLNSEPTCLFCPLLRQSIIYSTSALPTHLNSCYGDDEVMSIPLFAPLVATILKTWWLTLNLQLNCKHTYSFISLCDNKVHSLALMGPAYSACLYKSTGCPWSYSDSCEVYSTVITAYCHAQHSSSSCWTSSRFSRWSHHRPSPDQHQQH